MDTITVCPVRCITACQLRLLQPEAVGFGDPLRHLEAFLRHLIQQCLVRCHNLNAIRGSARIDPGVSWGSRRGVRSGLYVCLPQSQIHSSVLWGFGVFPTCVCPASIGSFPTTSFPSETTNGLSGADFRSRPLCHHHSYCYYLITIPPAGFPGPQVQWMERTKPPVKNN